MWFARISPSELLAELRCVLFPAVLDPALNERIRGEQIRAILRLTSFARILGRATDL
jgi:hypothetical protein